MADQLPSGWVYGPKIKRNGTQVWCFMNRSTGQTFYTKEDLDRYVRYQMDVAPKLNTGMKMNFETGELFWPEGRSEIKASDEGSSIKAVSNDQVFKEEPAALEMDDPGKKVKKPLKRNNRRSSKGSRSRA